MKYRELLAIQKVLKQKHGWKTEILKVPVHDGWEYKLFEEDIPMELHIEKL